MIKRRVRMLESIAGMADPRPMAELDEKYRQRVAEINKGRQKPMSDGWVDNFIADMKQRDRYGEKPTGFPRDWAFKPGEETFIESTLAEKWQDAGICLILPDLTAAAGKVA